MGIRGKSGWVSDRKSPKTEERVMSRSRGKGEGSRIPVEGGGEGEHEASHGEWSHFFNILAQVVADRQQSTNSSGIFPITHMREKLSAQRDEMIEREAINCSASINCKSVVCQE